MQASVPFFILGDNYRNMVYWIYTIKIDTNMNYLCLF